MARSSRPESKFQKLQPNRQTLPRAWVRVCNRAMLRKGRAGLSARHPPTIGDLKFIRSHASRRGPRRIYPLPGGPGRVRAAARRQCRAEVAIRRQQPIRPDMRRQHHRGGGSARAVSSIPRAELANAGRALPVGRAQRRRPQQLLWRVYELRAQGAGRCGLV